MTGLLYGRVTFEPSAAPDLGGAPQAVVREALLPLLVWLRVPVLREVRAELSAVERFVLEAALALGGFAPAHIEDLTSLPRAAVELLARRLASQGALERQGSRFEVQPARAREVLERRTVIERRAGTLAFLYLPQTDDLMVFHPKETVEVRRLRRLTPAVQFPLPRAVREEGKSALLRRRVEERTVAHLPADVVTVATLEADALPSECPAYRCHGTVTLEEGVRRIRATLYGPDRKKRLPPGQTGPDIRVPADLTGAAGLDALWTGLADLPGEEDYQEDFWRAAVPEGELFNPPVRRGPLAWGVAIDGETAAALARGEHNLCAPRGVAVCSEEVIAETAVYLEPGDEEADELFLIDEVVRCVPAAPESFTETDLEALVEEVAGEEGVAADTARLVEGVKDRLWSLKHYLAVYALRAEEDFPYGEEGPGPLLSGDD
jgi:hypothetical protein